MTDKKFPALAEMGCKDNVLEAIKGYPSGIIIVSGKRYSGVTTTISALGNELQNEGFTVVSYHKEDSVVIPGIDSIVSENLDDLKKHLTSPYHPDVVIFDVGYDVDCYRLAYKAARAGCLAVIGIHADSFDDARFKFIRTISPTPLMDELISFSIHQENRPVSRDFFNIPPRRWNLNHITLADEILREANPDMQRVIDTGTTDTVFRFKEL